MTTVECLSGKLAIRESSNAKEEALR